MIDTKGCPNCAASGWHASALTNWDAVRCDDCGGTGRLPVLPVPVVDATTSASSVGMLSTLLDPEKVAFGRKLFAAGTGR